jgi:hypothetical protein
VLRTASRAASLVAAIGVSAAVLSSQQPRQPSQRAAAGTIVGIVADTAGNTIDSADACPAVIDGGPKTAPLWSIGAADIETLELYPPNSLMNYDPVIKADSIPGLRCPVLVYVWLRK